MVRWVREGGFTMAELLVVAAILGMIIAAIVGVYKVSLETHARTTSLEDAQLGARAGVERMVSDLRLIGAYWTGATGAGTAITNATASSITFMADINGDTVNGGAETTVTSNPNGTTVGVSGTASDAADAFDVYSNTALNDYLYIANGGVREVKQISGVAGTTLTLATGLTNVYAVGGLVRSVETVTYNYDASANTLTRSVGGSGALVIVENVTALTLSYFDASGNVLSIPPTLTQIREVQINLDTEGDDGSHRVMTSRASPRNL